MNYKILVVDDESEIADFAFPFKNNSIIIISE